MSTPPPSPEDRLAFRKWADDLIKRWADRGLLIEGGWQVFESHALATAGEVQRAEMRKSFYLGAQHLFACVMNMLDPDQEATEADCRRMQLIHQELEAFRALMLTRGGMPGG